MAGFVSRWLLLSAFATLALSLPLPGAEETEGYLLYGDVLVRLDQLNATRRGMKLDWRWPNGVVPYLIGAEYSDAHRKMITDAMADLMKYTCVKFVPRSTEKTYITIEKPGDLRCFSTSLGYNANAGGMLIALAAPDSGPTCMGHRSLIHELMHVLGVIHEQDREDRDYNVIMLLDNMAENANMVRRFDTVSLGVPYNTKSVMQYGALDYSVNGKPSIISTRPHHPVDRTQIPYSDFRRIARLYSCPQSYEDLLDKKEFPIIDIIPV